jgi:hypothetical protein
VDALRFDEDVRADIVIGAKITGPMPKMQFKLRTKEAAGLESLFRAYMMHPCACRKSDLDIMVVQAAEDRHGQNAPDVLDGSRHWSDAFERRCNTRHKSGAQQCA